MKAKQSLDVQKILLEKLPIAYFHVFPFSARKGTPAFVMKEHVLSSVKQQRGEVLRQLSNQKDMTFINGL